MRVLLGQFLPLPIDADLSFCSPTPSFSSLPLLQLFARIPTNRPRWDMYASLRGVSSTEDSAKLDRISAWNGLARAATNPSQSHCERSFSVPIELPTPFTDVFHAKELVPRPLRPRSESTKTYDSRRQAKVAVGIRAKRASVNDLVGKFESKYSGSDSAPTPIPRAATTPSSHLRSVYHSKVPGGSSPTRSLGQRPPRKRLVSSETVQEEGGPFTLQQVIAATSFTTVGTRAQTTVTELPAAPVVEPSPREDTSIRPTLEHYDQATQAKPDFQDQSVQAEDSYRHKSVQVSPACKDQAIQISAQYHDQHTQFTTHYIDQGGQSTSANESLQPGTTESHREPSEAKGKRSFHDQALQTDHDTSKVERSSAQKKRDSPGRSIHVVESEGRLRQALNPGHIVINENTEFHSSTDFAFFTARNCSTVSQTRRTGLLKVGVFFDPNTIAIELPEGAKVHMLQRIRWGKIVIDPGVLPRARSSEALAQGELYTPGSVVETEPKPAAQSSQSASSASCSSASCSSSLEGSQTLPPKFVANEASGAAEGSQYTESSQQLTSPMHQIADEPDQQQKVLTNAEATPPAEEVTFTATSFPKLPNAADPSEQAARLARVSGKRRASSVSYCFHAEDEDPNQVGSNTIGKPQMLGQFRSVPLIRVQRPSTDPDVIFELGAKAVKPSPSVRPLVPTADPPSVQTENVVLPSTSLPTASTGQKKHFRDRLRNRSSKQAVPYDVPASGKVGVRDRIKRKGRKKLIFRKKVLRFLLGKELAERVSQDLDNAGNTTRGATGFAQVANDASGTVPTSLPQLHEPALPLGVTPLAPAQMDGSDCRSTASGQSSSEMSLDAGMTPVILALDGSEERKAKHRASKEIKRQKKEQERQAQYEQAKTNLEALISTPCIKCGGQRAYILNFVWENKKKMIKHDKPDLKRRHRRKEVTKFVESIECRCPRGTSTAAYGSPEAVPRAKEMFRNPKPRNASQRISRHPGSYGGSCGGDGGALSAFAAVSHFGGHSDGGGFGIGCDEIGGGGGCF